MGKYSLIRFALCLLLVQVLALKHSLVQGQDKSIKFEQLSVNEGLSQSTVFSILNDSKGFVWLGTRTGGLNKYDGYSFTHYKKDIDDPHSICGNEVVSLFEDDKGNIWAGTRSEGLSRFDPKTEQFVSYRSDDASKLPIPDNTINSILQDSDKQLWIATNQGLAYYKASDDGFVICKNSINEKSFGHIYALAPAGEGQLLVATKSSGLFLLDTKTTMVVKAFQHDTYNVSSISSNCITTVLYDSKGGIWAGTKKNGLNYCSNIESGEFVTYVNDVDNEGSLANNIIRTLWEDKNKAIWVGTKDGLDVIEYGSWGRATAQFIHYQKSDIGENSLNQNSVYAFAEDAYGNFWVGTWSGGVNHLIRGGKNFEHYWHQAQNEKSLSSNFVSSFAETDEGLWVGTEGGGLNLYDSYTGQFTVFSSTSTNSMSLVSDHVKSLYTDSDGDLWVGTFDGLHLFNSDKSVFEFFLEGVSIYSIQEGVSGEIWIGGSNGLYKLNKDDFAIKRYAYDKSDKNSISTNIVTVIYKDKNEYLWIGTKKGINLYNRSLDNFIRFKHDREDRNSISNNYIAAIQEDGYGNLWVGTSDGLNKYCHSSESFTHYGQRHGLPDNVINNILSDTEGHLWITTNRGLSKLSFSGAVNAHSDTATIHISEVRTFERSDGLQGNEFSQGACYRSENGELYFGGVNGYNHFHPNSIQENENIPPVVLSDFRLFNESVAIGADGSPIKEHISHTKEIKLHHKQTAFTFEFVALNYNSPEKNQYAYMLEGFDKDWVYVGNKREASFTNLAPGKYVFKVKAANNDGLWNEDGPAVAVVVKPAWWKTTVFYIVVILLVIALVFYVVNAREQQLKNNQATLESELAEGKKAIKEQQEKVEKQEQELQERNEKEKQVKWHNKGVIEMSKLISDKRNSLKVLAGSIIVEMVQYIGAEMGALYIRQGNNSKDQELTLMGGYALDNQHLGEKTVGHGEGLVGTCLLNKELMEIDDLPVGYATLSSGLGERELKHLTLVPVIYEGEVEGVIELVSFQKIPGYKINLIKTISETLAATLINAKAKVQIEQMLKESNEQKEALSQSEEELKQNLEELQATQEESARREELLTSELKELKKSRAKTV